MYGVTEHPLTEKYAIVMEYHPKGNLQSNLVDICNKTWDECVSILHNAAYGLSNAHEKGIIHCDLHSGNVLLYEDFSRIADFGLSKVANRSAGLQKGSYGVIPYMAPELFRGQPHSKATDVYAFGIIMWEVSSGELAFSDRDHNIHLMLDVCNGLRPAIVEDTPDGWAQLMKQCWDGDPHNRPTAHEMDNTIWSWANKSGNSIRYKKQYTRPHAEQHHSGAVYHSRFIPHITRPAPTDLHERNHTETILSDDEWEQLVSTICIFFPVNNCKHLEPTY